jgi:hypothetical protein
MTGRRKIDAKTVDDVIDDIDRLHACGYDRLGAWNLAQTCDHLTVLMRMSLDGFPPELHFPWPARIIGATLIRWMMVGFGWMPRRIPLPHVSMDPGDARAEQTAVSHCVATLREVRDRAEPFHASPLLGKMSLKQWRRFHIVHAVHHLSLLIPRQ